MARLDELMRSALAGDRFSDLQSVREIIDRGEFDAHPPKPGPPRKGMGRAEWRGVHVIEQELERLDRSIARQRAKPYSERDYDLLDSICALRQAWRRHLEVVRPLRARCG